MPVPPKSMALVTKRPVFIRQFPVKRKGCPFACAALMASWKAPESSVTLGRKRLRADLALQQHPSIPLNQTYDGDGAIIYKYACALGSEGIASKRRGSPYYSGLTDQWLKMKTAWTSRQPRARIDSAKRRRRAASLAPSVGHAVAEAGRRTGLELVETARPTAGSVTTALL